MKKPRLPTPEELADWQESNRGTKRVVRGQSSVASEDEGIVGAVGTVPPPARGERLGGGHYQSPKVPRTAPPKRPPSGEGYKKSPLKPLPQREAKRVFKTPIEATLDLHGMSKLDAYARVQQFVMRMHCARCRHVAIITGKGRSSEVGVLRSHLPHWLNEPALRPLISAFATARAEKGGEGVTHVLLKRVSGG